MKNIRAWLLPLLATILTVAVLGGTLLLRFLDLDTYKGEIVAQVRSSLKRELTYHSAQFSFRYGPSFSFSDVAIKEKDGVTDFVKANRLTINLAIIPLLRRELVLSRMHLEHPEIRLVRNRDGSFNVSDLLAVRPGAPSPGIRGIELTKARVIFTDAAVANPPLRTELSETDLYLSRLVRGRHCDVKLSGFLGSGAGKVPLSVAGVAKLPAPGIPLTATEFTGRLRSGAVDAGRFLPYYGRYLPFRGLAGQLAVDSVFKGRLSAFTSEGSFQVTRLNLDYPRVFHARLTPRIVKASYKLELGERDLNLSSIKAEVDGLKVQGSCRLSDIHSGDLRITAKASSNRFNLRAFRPYIPYGIIVKDTADFIEQKIPGGFYQLDQGRLDGRVSQILHMERGQNYNILSVKARVEDGEVVYGSGIPLFNGIKGELELAGKDFILRGMSARFGGSPFTLEGRIADYPLNSPARYLFSAIVHPRQREAAWMLGQGRGEKLSLAEGSELKLRGEGTTSSYNLFGEWDLSPVAYSYPEVISKPKGRHNTLSFSGTFGKDDFRLNSLNCVLAPLSLSATALNRYHGGLSVEVRTNQFQAAVLAPLIPKVRKYQPAGRLQAQLHGEGSSAEQLTWSGNLALADASFKATEKMKPITGINGNLRIGPGSVESSQLSVRVGNSTIHGKGAVNGFKSPTFQLSFASPLLDLADLGLPQGRVPLRAENVQGSIAYGKDTLQIGHLSGSLGKSVLQIKGSVQDLQHPVADLSVNSPHLDIDDMLPLLGHSSESGGHLTLRVHLAAAEGKVRDIPFQRLKATALLEDRVLQLQPVEFYALDGEATGKLRVILTPGNPQYQLSCALQRMSAERLLPAFGVKRQEVTGRFSLQADLSARGESSADWRKSANGTVKVKVEHGSLKKLATLSKIFSILNVSQLLKLHLPDMVTGGMPYNKITGDFAVKDGVASTSNVFIDSNAINVSTVGKVDLARNQLDLVIGVQPLQTVDKVVSRIPIVGWILTGKDHSLVSTYFEAKGHIDDPQVTAVPVKSLAKGVFNIFKRVFELPVRLVTDTGEVLINK